MRSVTVSGRFVNEHHEPIHGAIKFTPSKVWVEDKDGETYVAAAPEVELNDGWFSVELSATDTTLLPWHYTVNCPVGIWTIRVTGEHPLLLKDLLPKRFAG